MPACRASFTSIPPELPPARDMETRRWRWCRAMWWPQARTALPAVAYRTSVPLEWAVPRGRGASPPAAGFPSSSSRLTRPFIRLAGWVGPLTLALRHSAVLTLILWAGPVFWRARHFAWFAELMTRQPVLRKGTWPRGGGGCADRISCFSR
jgi:hypothetical protein